MITIAQESRVSLVIRGLAALVFGVLTLAWPGITLTALVYLWGAYALVDGIFTLVGESTRPTGHRVMAFIEAIAGIAAGVITFFWPGITALVLLWVIAIWLGVTGILELAAAFSRVEMVRPHWLAGVIGALSVAAAVILVVAPVAGALGITWAIGWYAIASAAIFFAWAWQAPSHPARHRSSVRTAGHTAPAH